MKLGNIFRALCIAAGIAAAAAEVIRRGAKQKSKMASPERCKPDPHPAAAGKGRDYFSITKSRGHVNPKWVLQGFGRFECFLLFDSWREAMDQACFRIENLATPELIQLHTTRQGAQLQSM